MGRNLWNLTIVFSLLADVLYQLADPRIRLGSTR